MGTNGLKMSIPYFNVRWKILQSFYQDLKSESRLNKPISVGAGIFTFLVLLFSVFNTLFLSPIHTVLGIILLIISSSAVMLGSLALQSILSGLAFPLVPGSVNRSSVEYCMTLLSQYDVRTIDVIGKMSERHREGIVSSQGYPNAVWAFILVIMAMVAQTNIVLVQWILLGLIVLVIFAILVIVSFLFQALLANADLVIEMAVIQHSDTPQTKSLTENQGLDALGLDFPTDPNIQTLDDNKISDLGE